MLNRIKSFKNNKKLASSPEWVSGEVKDIRKKHGDKDRLTFKNRIRILLSEPSRISLLVLVVLNVAPWLIYKVLTTGTGSSLDSLMIAIIPTLNITFMGADNTVGNTLVFYSILSFVIFAIAIFIAEYAFRSEEKDGLRVLLRDTFLWSIGVVVLLQSFFTLFFNEGFILSTFMCVILTICMIYRLFKTLLNPDELTDKSGKFFLDKVMQGVGETIDAKIGRNVFSSYLQEKQISYKPFINNKNDGAYNIDVRFDIDLVNTKEPMRISDVNLKKLTTLINKIEGRLNNSEYSLYNNKPIITQTPNNSGQSTQDTKNYEHIEDGVIVLKGFDDRIYVDNSSVLSISKQCKKILGENTVRDIEREIKDKKDGIFRIKYKRDTLRREFANTQGSFIAAIRNGNIAKTEQYADIHRDIIRRMLVLFKQYSAYQSSHEAYQERRSIDALFLTNWYALEYMKNSITIAMSEAIRSKNSAIISNVSSIYTDMILAAIVYKNHLIFQLMLDLLVYETDLCYSPDRTYLRGQQEDTLVFLGNILDIQIAPPIRKNNDIENTKMYIGFSDYIIATFYKLLKLSYGKKDIHFFESLCRKIPPLFSNSLERYTENIDTEIRFLDRNKNDSKKKRYQILRNTIDRKYQVLFGFFAWMVWYNQHKKDEDIIQEHKKMYSIIREQLQKLDIVKIIDVWVSSVRYDSEGNQLFDWDGMYRSHYDELKIEGSYLQTTDALSRALFLLAMNCNAYDIDQVAGELMEKGYGQHLKDWKSHNVITEDIFNEMKGFLGVEIDYEQFCSDEKLQQFDDLIQEVVERQDEKEHKESIALKITDEDRKKFFNDFLDTYNKKSSMRNIFEKYGKVHYQTSQYIKDKTIGINPLIEEKDMLFNRSISFSDMHGNFLNYIGANMGNIENNSIFMLLHDKISDLKWKPEVTDWRNGGIEQRVQDIIEKHNIQSPMIISNYFGFSSHEGEIPVVNVEVAGKVCQDSILVVSKDYIDKIVFYRAVRTTTKEQKKQDEKYLKEDGRFYFRISDLNKEVEMRKGLENTTDWIKKEVKENKEYLLERARIEVFEKMGVELSETMNEKQIGVIIKVQRN